MYPFICALSCNHINLLVEYKKQYLYLLVMKTHSNSIYQPIVLFIGAKLLSTGNRLFIGLFGILSQPLSSVLHAILMVYENLLLVHFFMGIILLQEVLYLAQMQ